VRSEALVGVNVKETNFRDVMPCSLVGTVQCLGGNFSHHLQKMRFFCILSMEAAGFSEVLVCAH
jgi:hypothetical protein